MKFQRTKLYSLYERVWHWVQAVAVLLLLLTGLEIRDHVRLIGFESAVDLHNVLGFFLCVNAFLGLFYFLSSGAIRQYVSEPGDYGAKAVQQASYYVRGIFEGEQHPAERTAKARLNPLQKTVYLVILNVLLPWQAFTGLAIWGLENWPRIEDTVGGLPILLPLHALGAWLFASFIVVHVYLTTTSGRRPLDGIKAMITGWEELPVSEDAGGGRPEPQPETSETA